MGHWTFAGWKLDGDSEGVCAATPVNKGPDACEFGKFLVRLQLKPQGPRRPTIDMCRAVIPRAPLSRFC